MGEGRGQAYIRRLPFGSEIKFRGYHIYLIDPVSLTGYFGLFGLCGRFPVAS